LKTKIFFVVLSFLFISHQKAFNQVITRHFMTNLPVSIHSNPSLFPNYRFHIGFPMVGNWYWETSTNISLKQIISKIENNVLYISPNQIISNLDRVNFISNNFNFELLSTSFKINKNFFSISATNKTFSEFRYPRDIFVLGWQGNGKFIGSKADFSGTGFDFINYNEYALGYSRLIGKKLYAGGRIKYLQGFLNFKTAQSDLSLKVDTTTYWLTSEFEAKIRIAAPVDTNGFSFNSISDIVNFGNPGFAFDLGASYKFTDKLNASISLVDMGYIHWTKNTKTYYLNKGKLAFEGLKIDSSFNFDFSDSALQVLQDTILEKFQFQKSYEPFSTALQTKLYLTATFDLTSKDQLGFLAYNRFSKYNNYMTYTLSYHRRFGNILHLTANYTLDSKGSSKIGSGMSLRIFGSHFYLLTDDIIGLISPVNAHSISLMAGWYYIKSKPKKSAVPKSTF